MELKNFNEGFTLAEVLITLGIIGIVAALTIPGLLTKINNAQYKVIYKKTYSTINQALKYAEESGEIDLSIPEISKFNAPQVGEIFKFLSRYYNAKITCFNNNADQCWECDKGEAGYRSGGAPDWLGCSKGSYAFMDTNGVAYYLYSNKEYPILIDVNGKTRPNQLGRDRFVLRFAYSIESENNYPSTVDSVIPLSDKVNKERWCPQGNCYYKTWLERKK